MRKYFLFFILIITTSLFSNKSKALELILSETPPYDSLLLFVNDKNIPSDEKYAVSSKSGHLPTEQITSLDKILISLAKKEKNTVRLMNLYARISFQYTTTNDFKNARLYLDSALVYEKNVEDIDALGVLHYIAGEYYVSQLIEEEAHKHYHQAVHYFEQSKTKRVMLNPLYYNMAIYYLKREDTLNLKKYLDKMQALSLEEGNKGFSMNTYSIAASYYAILYEKDKSQVNMLDSVLSYNIKAIELFESIKDQLPEAFAHQIAYNYISVAGSKTELNSTDWRDIESYLEKGREYASPIDTTFIISYHDIKGLICLKQKKYDEAESEIQMALQLSDTFQSVKDNAKYIDLYELLSEIYEAKGNFSEALKCEKLKSGYETKLHDKEKYTAIMELQTKYDTEKKEQKVEQLTMQNNYQRNILLLFIAISVLLILSLLFLYLWFKSKQKADANKLQVEQLKKEEAELQARLKEEQAVKLELEKYEVLIDSHFKDLEIEGKEEELKELKQEKLSLDKQIRSYENKINRYEQSVANARKRWGQPAIQTLQENMKNLITQKLIYSQQAKEYILKVNDCEEELLIKWDSKCDGGLSASNMNYSLCFYCGMDTKDIASCFDVETSSIHITRYRLKRKFGLDKDADLDLFLRSFAT